MMYVARCKKGLVVAGAIANTPLQQAENARSVKSWIKSGYTVTLEASSESINWCFDGRCKKCEKEDIKNG